MQNKQNNLINDLGRATLFTVQRVTAVTVVGTFFRTMPDKFVKVPSYKLSTANPKP